MPVNSNRPELWKADVAASVDLYNDWFMLFAPETYRDTRIEVTERVLEVLRHTDAMRDVSVDLLVQNPAVLSTLRMSMAPPIARDRLVGLSGTSPNLVKVMEEGGTLPLRMPAHLLRSELEKIVQVFKRLLDVDVFPWLNTSLAPNETERTRAATVIADRLCGARADPIIRNAQEKRQLRKIGEWLAARGYRESARVKFDAMAPGTFSFRLNVQVQQVATEKLVNIPIDAVVMPKAALTGALPLLIEAKSAGDYTNPNKRRKEEATKIAQLRLTYGSEIRFILFLCGYFNTPYLGYEAAEGIDWVWEHRMDDLLAFGL